MKCFRLLLLHLLFIAKSFGQTNCNQVIIEITKEKRPSKIYTKAAFKDTCTDLDSTFLRHIEAQLNKSTKLCRSTKKGKYIVEAKFIVAKDGSLSEISCTNNSDYELCQEVLLSIKRSAFLRPRSKVPVEVIPIRH